jgi:hypothetical protein
MKYSPSQEANITLKGKAIPAQVWTDPEGSRRLRLPDFMTNDGSKFVKPAHRPPLPPTKYSSYSLLLEAA